MGFWNDHRYRGADRKRWAEGAFDEKEMTLTVEIPMDPCEFCPYGDKEPAEVSNYCSSCDYPEHEVLTVPAKFEVCPTCRGRGKHVNPNIDDRGISAEDFEEDPDFAEVLTAYENPTKSKEIG